MTDRPTTPEEHALSFELYLRMRGIHPEQIAERKAKTRAKGKAQRKARKAQRKR